MKKRAAILSYLTIVFNLLYSVGMTPFIIRTLGQSEYGVYTLCTSVISYLGLFQFGFSTTYLRYFIKFNSEGEKKKAEELNGMFLIIFAVISGIVLTVGAVLVVNAQGVFGDKITQAEYDIAKPMLTLVIINVMITTIGVPFQALLNAYEEFVFQKLLTLCEIVLKTLVLILCLHFGARSIAIVAVSTGLSIITFICNAAFVFRKLKVRFCFTNFDASLFREMIGFSFFVFLQSIMDMFNWQIDKFLLARFWGTKEIGVYSLGSNFSNCFISLAGAITALYVPYANRLVAEKRGDEALSALMIRIGRLQFMLGTFIFSALAFLGRPFIRIYAGEGFENAYGVALLLIAPLILPLSMELWFHIARAKALHKTSTTVFTLVALLNTLISIPLCRRYGELGAAAGTCIGMFIANNGFQIWYSQHVIHLDMKLWAKNLLRICPALILPCAAGSVMMNWVTINTLWDFLMWAVAYTAITAVSFWLFAMNDSEKDLLRVPLRRLTHFHT